MKSVLMLALIACGTNSTATDPDGNPGGNTDAHDSSVTTPPGYMEVPVTCTDYTRTTVHTATDGSKDVLTNSWAFFNFTPADDFIVQSCQAAPVDAPCGGGNTCTGTAVPPGATQCSVMHSGGIFVDGKLAVYCGSKMERYLANGTLQSSTVMAFAIHVESR